MSFLNCARPSYRAACPRIFVASLGLLLTITSIAQVAGPNSVSAGKLGEQPQKSSRPAAVIVRGQVFVVTKGRDNIKLGLVTVGAFSTSDIERQTADIAKRESERLIASRSRAAEREERVAARAAAIEQARMEEAAARDAAARDAAEAAKGKAGLARALDSATLGELLVPKAGDGAEVVRLKSELKTLAAYRLANPNSDYAEYQGRYKELEVSLRAEIFKQAGLEPGQASSDRATVTVAESRLVEAAAALARAEAIPIPSKESSARLGIDGYISLLRNPLASTKTDADGNFELALPPGIYVLAASASRTIPDGSKLGKTEDYSWLIKVDARRSGQRILLSNDNMSGSICAECVLVDIAR